MFNLSRRKQPGGSLEDDLEVGSNRLTGLPSHQSSSTFTCSKQLVFECFSLLLVLGGVLLLFRILQFASKNFPTSQFEAFADLLTQKDQESELSYGWYRKQLESKSLLGNHQFSDRKSVV